MDVYPIVAYSLTRDVFTGPLSSNGCRSIVVCWNVFTEPLPSNALSKPVTILQSHLHLCNDVPLFKPGSGHVGSVVDKVALGQVFSEYFGFPCQSPFHQFLHNHHHLSSGAGTIGQ
jgi:hypothetical protein